MGRYPQKSNSKGSLKRIQCLINNNVNIINSEIQTQWAEIKNIEWVSPKSNDDYAEYRDQAFMDKLSIENVKETFNKFWPKMGHQWDALAKADNEKIILVEAKANIPELVTPPTSAKAKTSLDKINNSLLVVKKYVNSKSTADWSQHFYQYCNRLAHLHFLRKKLKKDAYLIFIYFIGDNTVDGPKTKSEWVGAIKVMKQYLGIDKKHKLSRYVMDVFIDVNSL